MKLNPHQIATMNWKVIKPWLVPDTTDGTAEDRVVDALVPVADMFVANADVDNGILSHVFFQLKSPTPLYAHLVIRDVQSGTHTLEVHTGVDPEGEDSAGNPLPTGIISSTTTDTSNLHTAWAELVVTPLK